MSKTRVAVLLAFVIALAGCASHYSYLRISSGNAFAERRGGGPTHVAGYRNGEIVGAAAVESEGLCCRTFRPRWSS